MNTLAKLIMTTVILTASMSASANEVNTSVLSEVKAKVSEAIAETVRSNLDELKLDTKAAVKSAFTNEQKVAVKKEDDNG